MGRGRERQVEGGRTANVVRVPLGAVKSALDLGLSPREKVRGPFDQLPAAWERKARVCSGISEGEGQRGKKQASCHPCLGTGQRKRGQYKRLGKGRQRGKGRDPLARQEKREMLPEG